MEFSQVIIQKSQNPKFKVNEQNHKVNQLFKLDNLGVYVELFLDLETKGEDQFITGLSYKTALEGPSLGLLDGLIELYQDKALEAISRISAKELDHFLRDTTSTPAVSFYDTGYYEILSLGSKLVEKLVGDTKKERFLYEDFDGDFVDLSFSEQIEVFEEFLAKKVYPFRPYEGTRFDLLDVEEGQLILEVKGHNFDGHRERFQNDLSKELNLAKTTIKIEGQNNG